MSTRPSNLLCNEGKDWDICRFHFCDDYLAYDLTDCRSDNESQCDDYTGNSNSRRRIVIFSDLMIEVEGGDHVENFLADHQDNHSNDAENNAFDDKQREVF